MTKRHKRSLRRRRQTTFLILILVIIMVASSPFIWRLERIRQAESVYDVQRVQEELQWWGAHGGLLNKLGMIKDASLWLDLNVGGENLESKLALYQDEKHQFWLFLLNLQKGKMTEAQDILPRLDQTPLGQLGQGLMLMSKGDVEESSQVLRQSELDWKSIPKHAQTLRHLTLAQAAIIMGDHQVAQTELEAAQRLEPKNPACLTVAFDLALGESQWDKAKELSQIIVAQTWYPKNTLFETKKAVLAIQENDIQELSNSLSVLKELPQGDAYIKYVNGVQALSKGQLQEGKALLQRALEIGLEGGLKVDAQKSLDQVTTRQNADKRLHSIVVENG
ncbi:tetratricopeptide repeat protein [Desulfosporosinus fructosivorans]